MIKISGYPIVAGAILCALQSATGPPAFALDRWVELTNNTRMTIVEIFISHAGAEFWNVDRTAPIIRNLPDISGWQTTRSREWTGRPRRGKLAPSVRVLKLLNSRGFLVSSMLARPRRPF